MLYNFFLESLKNPLYGKSGFIIQTASILSLFLIDLKYGLFMLIQYSGVLLEFVSWFKFLTFAIILKMQFSRSAYI